RLRGVSRRGASSVGREPALSVGLLVFMALLAPSLAFSQPSEENAAPASSDAALASSVEAPKLDGWWFEFTPYAWLPEIYGKVQVRRVSASFHVDYDQIFDLLGDADLFAAMGHFEAHYRRLSLFVDAVGVHAKPSGELERATVDSTLNTTFVEFGPAYRLVELPSLVEGKRPITIDGLVGGRFMYFYSKLSLKGERGRVSASDSGSSDWVDPFVGGRWLVP